MRIFHSRKNSTNHLFSSQCRKELFLHVCKKKISCVDKFFFPVKIVKCNFTKFFPSACKSWQILAHLLIYFVATCSIVILELFLELLSYKLSCNWHFLPSQIFSAGMIFTSSVGAVGIFYLTLGFTCALFLHFIFMNICAGIKK